MALPRAVQEQDERANAAWKAQYQPDEDRNPEDEAAEAQPQDDAAPPAEAQESAPVEQGEDYWKQRFNVLQGKYNSEIRQLSEANRDLKQRNERNESRLGELEQSLQDAKRNQTVDVKQHFSESDIDEFGEDTLRLVHRVANSMADEKVSQARDEFKGEVEQVRQTTQQSEEQRFWDTLNASVTDWNQINDDPAFHTWLSESVPVHTPQGMQQQTRQSLLDSYAQDHNARAVIDLFTQFRDANSGERGSARAQREVPPRSQGGGNTPPPQGEPWISREDIKAFYRDKLRWERRDPEACRAREREIERAVENGRVSD